MENQLLETITKDITKIPNKEYYQIQKYLNNQPVDEYLNVRFVEKDGDFICSGIKDTQLLDILIYRLENKNKDFQIISKLLLEAKMYLKLIENCDQLQ